MKSERGARASVAHFNALSQHFEGEAKRYH